MNYLELVQRAIKESGAHLDMPDTLSGIDGLQSRFADWVNQAWVEMQMERPEWQFRQDESAITLDPLALDDEVIALPDNLDPVFEDNWRFIALGDVYIHNAADSDSVPEKLHYVTWNRWPDVYGRYAAYRAYNINNDSTEGKPVWYTINPEGNLQVYPRPDKAYQIQFFAPKAIQELETDTDEPYLDEEYRLAIVFRSMMEYGLYHDDRTVFERARNKYRSYKKALEYRYMPDVHFATDQLYRDI